MNLIRIEESSSGNIEKLPELGKSNFRKMIEEEDKKNLFEDKETNINIC